MSNWKQEHDFLYDESGNPTEEFHKLEEETQEPGSTNDEVQFPVIRVSNRANVLMDRLRNMARRVDKKGRGAPRDQTNESDAHKELAQYIEHLEYELGIPRETQRRF